MFVVLPLHAKGNSACLYRKNMSDLFSIAGTSMSENKITAKKLKVNVPLVIVEDHNDVLYHIYRAIGSKRLPFEGGCMVHFDSHPDMMIPKSIDINKIFEKEHVLNSLSIENWIMPSVYAGHFSTLIWIKPEWALQLENGTHCFKIGADKSSKEIKVTCTQSYFVSELAWCPDEDLENARDVTLEVRTLGEPLEIEGAPGSSAGEGDSNKELKVCTLSNEVLDPLSGRPYVLDIDLDFYSTRNPFLSLFTEEQFAFLRELYHYEHPKTLSKEALQEVTASRKQQLSELESIFKCIKDGKPPLSSARLAAVEPLLATFPEGRPPDPGLLNDAGCTCDDCDLPHHVSSRDHIRHLVEATRKFLLSLPKPGLITIARSSNDDYCPPEDVDFIQELVLEMLEQVYGTLDVTKDYDEIPQLVEIPT